MRLLIAAVLATFTLVLGACSGQGATGSKEVTIDLVGGKSSTVTRIEVSGGAKVTMHITSDQDDIVHVHGYDLEFSVGPSGKVTKEFVADQLGSYEIETHSNGNIIAQLVVR